MENKQFYENGGAYSQSVDLLGIDLEQTNDASNGETTDADSTRPLLLASKVEAEDAEKTVHAYKETCPDDAFNLLIDTTIHEPGGHDTVAYTEISYSDPGDTGSYGSATLLIPAGETNDSDTGSYNSATLLIPAGETSYSNTGSYDSATLLIPAGETNDNDTASYGSATLLIPTEETRDQILPTKDSNLLDLCLPALDTFLLDAQVQRNTETIPYKDITENVHKMETIPERGACPAYLGHSSISIDDDFIPMVEEITVTPLNIIGSGWEFGSMTSIHRRPVDAFRSRTNSMESKTDSMWFKNDGDTDSRMLSRIFANQIDVIDRLMKSTDDLDLKNSVLSLSIKAKDAEVGVVFPKRRNFKNIMAVSLGALLLLISLYGLRNLQSSMNSEGGIGVISMCIQCTMFMVGSLVSRFAVQRYGPKRCLVFGSAAHLPFVFANFYVTWLTIIPSSVILGLGSAVAWNSFSTYITETGILESHSKNKKSEHIISRYFGIFFMAVQMAMVMGNLISSLILVPKSLVESSQIQNISAIDQNTTMHNISEPINAFMYTLIPSNQTQYSNESGVPYTGHARVLSCGIGFCNDDIAASQAITNVDKLFLLGTYALCGFLSVIVLQFWLDYIPCPPTLRTTTISPRDVFNQALSVVSMVMDTMYALIVPLCLYSYMSIGFVIADVLKAYVTCPLGIYMVGYMMICNGLCGTISSYTFCKLVRYTGRVPVFVTAAAINLASMAGMATWRPASDDIYFLFVCIGSWGFADGIWQSQLNSLISTVFADRYETAFGTFRVLQGVAGMLVFGMSTMFCMNVKLAITAAMCLLSLVCYLIMELRWKRGEVVKEIVVKIKA